MHLLCLYHTRHCNTRHCNTRHCNTRQHAARHSNTLQHTAIQYMRLSCLHHTRACVQGCSVASSAWACHPCCRGQPRKPAPNKNRPNKYTQNQHTQRKHTPSNTSWDTGRHTRAWGGWRRRRRRWKKTTETRPFAALPQSCSCSFYCASCTHPFTTSTARLAFTTASRVLQYVAVWCSCHGACQLTGVQCSSSSGV